jgi:hypothetical protein
LLYSSIALTASIGDGKMGGVNEFDWRRGRKSRKIRLSDVI